MILKVSRITLDLDSLFDSTIELKMSENFVKHHS